MKTILVSIFAILSTSVFAQNPLQSFESIIGGEWWLGEESYQTFEWGVGNLSVKGESYFVINGEHVKVSDGEWFYHPGENKIRGFFNAKNMPINFFDYETSFDDKGNMINSIIGFGSMGNGLTFHETWEFTSENSFIWTLSTIGEDGSLTEMMKDTYNRK